MNDSKIMCDYCSKQLSKMSNWTRHMKEVHLRNVDGKLIIPTKLLCSICGKVFKKKRALDTHTQTMHTERIIYNCEQCNFKTTYKRTLKSHTERHRKKNMNPSTVKPFKCSECDSSFVLENNLNYHKRNRHNIGKTSTTFKRKCPICRYIAYGLSQKIINGHFESVHNIKLKPENYTFLTISEFDSWKRKIEKETTSSFRNRQSYTLKGVSTRKYQCHRSGTFITKSLNKRKLKLAGSCKINGFCPASIKVICKNNIVSVIYQPIHVGHKCDLKHIHLTKEERQDIATQLTNGKPSDIIMTNIRNSITNSELSRFHLVDKKDIANIRKSLNWSEGAVNQPFDSVTIDTSGKTEMLEDIKVEVPSEDVKPEVPSSSKNTSNFLDGKTKLINKWNEIMDMVTIDNVNDVYTELNQMQNTITALNTVNSSSQGKH